MSLRPFPKSEVVFAAATHLFTAAGAAFGFLALLAATRDEWELSFGWLGIALLIDGADGPLARRLKVAEVLPRFSGEDLDKVIDYLTYVTVPALIVARGPVVPPGLQLWLGLAIMLVSLYHFADKQSKTAAGYFMGFPAIWNLVVFYCLVLDLSKPLAATLLAICAFLTFVPFSWVHPVRVRRLRPLTLAVIIVWSVAAIAALEHGFPAAMIVKLIFIACAAYILLLGVTAKPG